MNDLQKVFHAVGMTGQFGLGLGALVGLDFWQRALFWVVAAGVLAPCAAGAQATPAGPGAQPIRQAETGAFVPPEDQKLFQEIDLLRRNDFEKASQATVSMKVVDGHGNSAVGLGPSNFVLIVNGHARTVHLVKQAKSAITDKPMVMLVFPPNQPEIHYIAVRDAIRYFSSPKSETMSWKVGLFDSNGSLSSFTDQRTQLLANLEAVRTAKEPAQFTSDRILAKGAGWDGGWLTKVNNAMTGMQSAPGPKLIMAMNPLGVPQNLTAVSLLQGRPVQPLVDGGPMQLTPIAQAIGAHIYIANVGGPEPIVPGGGAAEPASIWGTIPSLNQRIDPAQTIALNYYAAATSQMMQTAEQTLGGFANSIGELAAKMQHDLDSAYHFEFEMTGEDQDLGIPAVSVELNPKGLRASILEVAPVLSVDVSEQRRVSRETAHALLASISKPVASPDFEISQRVDYFPVKAGLEAVLPMSCLITWRGRGERPREIVIVESVVDHDLSATLLERKLDSSWNKRSVYWERDGQLRPGHYVWRVAVASPNGHVLASAQENVTVAFPRNPAVAMSSLVVGNGCDPHPSANGLRKRPPPGSAASAPVLLTVDPMQIDACRFATEPDVRFRREETLHAFLRIYPVAKLEKNRPEAWAAHFTMLSAAGAVEATQQVPFRADLGSGLVAHVAMPLGLPGVGTHSLRVVVEGPGLKKPMSEVERFSVEP